MLIWCGLNDRPISIGERAKDARLHFGKSQQEMADFLGLSVRAWQKMERNEGVPSGETLLLFEAAKINPGWILTGLGDMFADPSIAPPPAVAIDPELIERLYKEVDRAYSDLGQKVPQHRVANEAAALYNALLAKITDIREVELVDAVIPVLMKDLKTRLQTASKEPGTSKRSA